MPRIVTTKSYGIRCHECGWTASSATEEGAEVLHDEHVSLHRTWALLGAELRGQVFDSNAPEHRRFGHVYRAAEAAKADGYLYLSWNGRVYSVHSPMNPTVCLASDVPELTP